MRELTEMKLTIPFHKPDMIQAIDGCAVHHFDSRQGWCIDAQKKDYVWPRAGQSVRLKGEEKSRLIDRAYRGETFYDLIFDVGE